MPPELRVVDDWCGEILYNAIGHYRTKPEYALYLVWMVPIEQEVGTGAGFKMAISNGAAARLIAVQV